MHSFSCETQIQSGHCLLRTFNSSEGLGSVQVLYKHVRRGGGSEGNAYFAYVVAVGGLEAKCLYCLSIGSNFLSTWKWLLSL